MLGPLLCNLLWCVVPCVEWTVCPKGRGGWQEEGREGQPFPGGPVVKNSSYNATADLSRLAFFSPKLAVCLCLNPDQVHRGFGAGRQTLSPTPGKGVTVGWWGGHLRGFLLLILKVQQAPACHLLSPPCEHAAPTPSSGLCVLLFLPGPLLCLH